MVKKIITVAVLLLSSFSIYAEPSQRTTSANSAASSASSSTLRSTRVSAGPAAIQLSKLLSQYTTYQADFVQTTFDEKHRPVQSSRGKMYLVRPGKFRWETTKPTRQLVIINGHVMWIYDVALAQATQQTFSYGNNSNPATLLTGKISDLVENYRVETLSSTAFRLKPRQSNTEFQYIDMTFRQNYLTTIRVLNNLGQINSFDFRNSKINQSINNKLFEFKPPKGVEVLKQ